MSSRRLRGGAPDGASGGGQPPIKQVLGTAQPAPPAQPEPRAARKFFGSRLREAGPVAVLGTDTAIGKTYVTLRLAAGLRQRGDRVWLHKPIACGGWQGGAWPDGTAEDARRLAEQLGDGQPLETLCPVQFPGECSPFLAAAALGQSVPIAQLVGVIRRLEAQTCDLGAWLLVETAGGLLSPIAAKRATNADLLVASGLPAVLVTSARLGTQNHTALAVAVARQRGIRLLGLVVNQTVPGSGAELATIQTELSAITGLTVLATLGESDSGDGGLAEALAECPV